MPFGIILMYFGIAYSLLEKGLLADLTVYPSTGLPYEFNIIAMAVSSLVAGLVIGVIEILFLNKLFRKRSFLLKICIKTLVYMVLICVLILLISAVNNAIQLEVSLLSKVLWDNAILFLSTYTFWTVQFYVAMGVSISLFYTEVSDNIGQEVLLNFFTGKYHHPIEEDRIFMFLDMKSSTTIAEQLGHLRYFSLLKNYYVDLSKPVTAFGGQLYQYVGDEVVISWNLKKGTANNNCLHCFFAMKTALEKQALKYESEYGVVPTFKAGLHVGRVTTGEIGLIKKDIAFTGDVLNTTARIQGLCNTYDCDLLISEQLVGVLDLEKDFQLKEIGETALRGRNEKINLFTVSRASVE